MKSKIFTTLITAIISFPLFPNLHAQSISTIASGLNNPVGISRNAAGNLWVTEAGTGNNDGKVSVIDTNGIISTVITGLPSHYDTATNEISGSWRTLILPQHRILVIQGSGVDPLSSSLLIFNINNFVFGVSDPLTPANIDSVINIGNFIISQGFSKSNPYDVSKDNIGDILVTDASANGIVKVAPSGSMSFLSEFAPIPNIYTPFPAFIDPVPTAIQKKSSGEYYVAFLTGFPFVPGISSIINLSDNGDTSLFMGGFSQVVDMEIDTVTGDLYVLQFGEYDSAGVPIPNTAAIKIISGIDSSTLISGSFGPAAGLTVDGNGGVYVTTLSGEVLHITNATGINTLAVNELPGISAFPNPLTATSEIRFFLKRESLVQLSVENMLGQNVVNKNEGFFSAGNHLLNWSGNDDEGKNLPAGNFIIRLTTNEEIETCKIAIIR